jgi:hypothetical protein
MSGTSRNGRNGASNVEVLRLWAAMLRLEILPQLPTLLAGAAPDGAPPDPSAAEALVLDPQLPPPAPMRGLSLVVVPAQPGTSALSVAQKLLEIGRHYPGAGVKLFDAAGASFSDGTRIAAEMAAHIASGRLAVANVDPILEGNGGIPVALAADKAVLVVWLGKTELSVARATIEAVGRDRFIGCVAVRAP